MSFKKICIKDEQIKIIKDWLKPKSVQYIQVFIGFANFYWYFIQSFNKISAPLISILKIILAAFIDKAQSSFWLLKLS